MLAMAGGEISHSTAPLRAVVSFLPRTSTKMKYWHFNKEFLFFIDHPMRRTTAARRAICHEGQTGEGGRDERQREGLERQRLGMMIDNHNKASTQNNIRHIG